ncbi:MAG: hypothetical protein ACOX1V_04015 [Candidatus Iainarchaeum sp.]|jgi:hypothetical protein
MNEMINKKTLEEKLLEYWYSIPNDRINPARAPTKIRIKSINESTILYEKINKKGEMYGIGCVSIKEINHFKPNQNYANPKIVMDPH